MASSQGARIGTVFVVDDDEAVCDMLRTLIEADGFKVQTWRTAEAFLADYEISRPGCLVLDLDLPGMDGLELAEMLLAQRARLPIIIVSGRGDLLTSSRAKSINAMAYLSKPFDNQLLIDCIRHAMA
ncbi:MAG TPA: response regulator [Burkholderiales bacterium]|nr:response regulator [Burkholderiales bacterium]